MNGTMHLRWRMRPDGLWHCELLPFGNAWTVTPQCDTTKFLDNIRLHAVNALQEAKLPTRRIQ
jgi:hypothetical protein